MMQSASQSQYNPEIHHRRSIRLKGHDYAGGGVYFVTICAHRNAGNIFAPQKVKAMVAQEWGSAVGAGLVSAHSEMRDLSGNLAAAEQRNRFVLENADTLWLPHVTPGGMLDRLVREMNVQAKISTTATP